jgi:hypothetical protein
MEAGLRYTASTRTAQRAPLPTALLLFRAYLLRLLPSNCRYLQNHYLATAVLYLLISPSLPNNGSTYNNTKSNICKHMLNNTQWIKPNIINITSLSYNFGTIVWVVYEYNLSMRREKNISFVTTYQKFMSMLFRRLTWKGSRCSSTSHRVHINSKWIN